MLLTYDTAGSNIEKMRSKKLSFFDFDERKLQDILFRAMSRLFPDDELLMIMQSRRWREEPDLMALDKKGNLFIFELKATESNPENILQVLRYAQLYGNSDIEKINKWYKTFNHTNNNIQDDFQNKFGQELNDANCNKHQTFVVITNGIDFRTREAIKYWRSCNLDIRPWIYRVYGDDKKVMNLEISPFRVEDNPYEDIAEGYYLLNTNYNNSQIDHNDMLKNKKCAAYFDPWKYNIQKLNKSDVIFLYQSGVGIVAFGETDGKLLMCDYQNNPNNKDEEYYMKLNDFHILKTPLQAFEMKNITGINYCFMQTMFAIDDENGRRIRDELTKRL